MRLAWALVLILVLPVAGCMAPYRPHVDEGALARLPAWQEARLTGHSEGWLGPNFVETRYTRTTTGAGPPFAGMMQAFGLREVERRSDDALLDLARDIVADAMEREHIQPIEATRTSGARVWRSGVDTEYFVVEGTVRQPGALFAQDVTVRVLGEVGHDGRTRTSFVVVGLAQVARQLTCPPVVPCAPEHDARTWIQIAGDPRGSIGGATFSDGLAYNLVTH